MTDTTKTAAKTPAKKAAPAKPKALTAADVRKLKAPASMKPEQAARVGTDAGDGYVVRWPKKGHDLLQKTHAAPADGPAWYVRCNEHGTVKAAAGTADGEKTGAAAERQKWCPGCKRGAAAKA
jgi:hypothetical protein